MLQAWPNGDLVRRTMPQHDLCDCQHRDRRGIIVDGKLLLGSHDFAGEIGHMIMVENGPLCGCGRRGCFETLASGTAIARRAQEAVRLECQLLCWN